MEFVMERIEVPPKHPLVDLTKVKLVKVNRTTVSIKGSVEFFVDADNKCMLELISYQNQGNEYRRLPFKLPKRPLCKFLEEQSDFYNEFQPHTDMPKDCPIPKGLYNINFIPNPEVLPDFLNGKYMVELIATRDFNVIATVKGYFEIRRY
jgi:hypothetical protein